MSEPFDPDAYLNSTAFNPDEYLAKTAPPPAASGPTWQKAMARGGLQGATLGYGDEGTGLITGAIQKTLNALPLSMADKVAGLLGAGDFAPAPAMDAYRFSRNTERLANAEAQKAHGGEYLGGNLIGGLATAPLLPGGGAKGWKQLAKTGAKLGAIGGFGMSDADLTTGELKNYGRAALDTGIGTAVGAGLGAGFGKLFSPSTPEALQSFANQKALNALGALKPQMNELGYEAAQKLGLAALRKKVVTPIASKATMATRAEALRSKAGKAISGALDESDALALPAERINSIEAAARLDTVADELAKKPALAGIADKFKAQAEIIRTRQDAGPMSLSAFEENVARPYKQITNWSDNISLPKQTMQKLPMALEGEVERIAGNVDSRTGAGSLAKYLQAKSDYGTAAGLSDIAQEGLKRGTNNSLGLPALLMGAATATAGHSNAGHLLMGALGAGGGKLLSLYGDQLAATGANRAASIIRALRGSNVAEQVATPALSALERFMPALRGGSDQEALAAALRGAGQR